MLLKTLLSHKSSCQKSCQNKNISLKNQYYRDLYKFRIIDYESVALPTEL